MRVVKADDYQTWFIEDNGFGILIDPWLDKRLNPNSSILLQRERRETSSLSQDELDRVEVVIITAPFIDHLHIPSIKKLHNKVKIITTKKVKKILIKNKIDNEIICINNQTMEVGPLKMSTFPAGFPYSLSAFCFFLENDMGKTIFHEGHKANFHTLKKLKKKCDVVLITLDSVKFLGIITLSMSSKDGFRTASLLDSKRIMATGTKPNEIKGLIKYFLSTKQEDELTDNKFDVYTKKGDEVVL